MASLTFGSVGDIIATCGILRNVVLALSESRGSATEYQALVRELQVLSQAVSSIHLLLEKHPQLKENDRLRALLADCRDSLAQELEHIKPYRAALQSKPTASALNAICRKVRWLAGKEERAIFRAAIASHVLALSAVLSISGVETQYQLHDATVERIQAGLEELRLAGEQFSRASEASAISLKGSVQDAKAALTRRHDRSDERALVRYEEINKRLDALQLTVSEQQGQTDDCSASISPSMVRNRVYMMLMVKLFTELASMGLAGAYHFLQVVQLMVSYRALHFFPQSRYLLVEDAILRQFVIDIDLMPYETFTKLIEDKFADTPGASAIASKQYFFEDKKRHRLNLGGVWSSEILRGRTVFMRARIDTGAVSGKDCPVCWMPNVWTEADEEISCICGCKYTTVANQPVSEMIRVFPGMHREAAVRAHKNQNVVRFFKRVERILQRTSSIERAIEPDEAEAYQKHMDELDSIIEEWKTSVNGKRKENQELRTKYMQTQLKSYGRLRRLPEQRNSRILNPHHGNTPSPAAIQRALTAARLQGQIAHQGTTPPDLLKNEFA